MLNNIILTDLKMEERMANVAKFLSGHYCEINEEQLVEFDNHIGTGKISGYHFDDGVDIMLIDFEVKETFSISYQMGRQHPIIFGYCNFGSIQVSCSGDHALDKLIAANEAAIYACKGDSNYTLTFEAGQKVSAIFIGLIRFLFLRKIECDLDTLPSQLQSMFKDTMGDSEFHYTTIAEIANLQMMIAHFTSVDKNLERRLLIESYTYKLITDLIRRFRNDKTSRLDGYRFDQQDIQRLNEVKNYIMDNIQSALEIKQLSVLIGMSGNKLQKGFYLMYGKSIKQFIISTKLNFAAYLLSKGNISVTEVANKLGYINKGHFSALFKKEFGLSPKHYK